MASEAAGKSTHWLFFSAVRTGKPSGCLCQIRSEGTAGEEQLHAGRLCRAKHVNELPCNSARSVGHEWERSKA